MAEEEDIIDEELEDDDDFGGPGVGSGRSKIVTILLWVAGGTALILLMFAISFLVANKVRTESYKEEQNIVIAPAPPPMQTFKFQKEFRVNTADTDESHFIQMSLTFGYRGENKELESELIARQSQMMHIINILLGGKKKEDLATQTDKLNLEEEIKSQINMILREGQIDDVYFEELVVS